MDQIEHKFIDIGGLKLHVAEIGTGPSVVLFLHGFSEIWYSWRHQMIAVANAGFRAIAPDYRGYGLSDQPSEPEKTTFSDIVSDLVAILDFLGITKCWLNYKGSKGCFPRPHVKRKALQRQSSNEEVSITDPKVKVPVLLIMGNKDYVFKFHGREDYLKCGMVKEFVLDLEITFWPEGIHFVQEQFPDQVLSMLELNGMLSPLPKCKCLILNTDIKKSDAPGIVGLL